MSNDRDILTDPSIKRPNIQDPGSTLDIPEAGSPESPDALLAAADEDLDAEDAEDEAPAPPRLPTAVIPRVLIVDDDEVLLAAVSDLLSSNGFRTVTASSAEQAIERLRDESFHLVLCDLQLPGRNGIALIKTIRDSCPSTFSVLITGHGSIRAAVTALKRGAVEYMSKPVKPKRLLALCRALTVDPAEFVPSKLLVGQPRGLVRFEGMVARSRAMHGFFEQLEIAARGDGAVVIVGEAGTGKKTAAHALHLRSKRAAAPFVTLSPALMAPDAVLEELLGGEPRTADPRASSSSSSSMMAAGGEAPVTVEFAEGRLQAAAGGTLYIDDLSALDDTTQRHLVKLLDAGRYVRVGGHAERKIDVRLIIATRTPLEALVESGQLRSDLCSRLGWPALQMPPLRDRVDDVPVLASHFIDAFAQKQQRDALALPSETQRLLSTYRWPGNVRELRNVVEQASMAAERGLLEPSLLPPAIYNPPPADDHIRIRIGTPMDLIEREVILRTLDSLRGNKTATAEALGISRRSIYNKLAEYGERRPSGSSQGATET